MGTKATALTNLVLIAASKLGFRLFKNPRGFDRERKVKYGLGPNGSHDLIGYKIETVTPDMIGNKIAIFTSLEIKTPTDTIKPEQITFRDSIIKDGGISEFIYDVDNLKGL